MSKLNQLATTILIFTPIFSITSGLVGLIQYGQFIATGQDRTVRNFSLKIYCEMNR